MTSDVTILTGDVLDRLADLPDESVDCVVTSPPYWGLRDYGVDGQLGLEPTLPEHLDAMVGVFRAVRRVLKPDGTCFVNYGDCYASTPNGRKAADVIADDRTFRDKPFSTVGGTLKPKDLCMVPNRFAIAMQDDGWWVRSEIIWAKPNPMPESVTDRPAGAHEKIFLFTKQPRYFWSADDVRRPPAPTSVKRLAQNVDSQAGSARANGGAKSNGAMKAVGCGTKPDKQRGHGRRHHGFNERWDQRTKKEQQATGRNLRNYEPAKFEVWEMATRPFKQAHFATFPEELARRCIAAGCPEGGTVLDPFGGAGTTALAAKNMARRSILIELNPEFVKIATDRLRAALCRIDGTATEDAPCGPLFDNQMEAAE